VDPMVFNMVNEDPGKVDYSSIGGLGEQIRELRESIELPLMNPELFLRVGIKPPKGRQGGRLGCVVARQGSRLGCVAARQGSVAARQGSRLGSVAAGQQAQTQLLAPCPPDDPHALAPALLIVCCCCP